MNTYTVEISDIAENPMSDFHSVTIETARTHIDAARAALSDNTLTERQVREALAQLAPEKALGGDRSTRSNDRFYATDRFYITVWKHA